MIFFGHIGPSLWAVRVATRAENPDWSVAARVAFWAVFPDLVDKSIFVLGWAPLPTARLWAHSLLACLAAVMLARFIFPSQWPWVLATPGHLLLDGMWDWPVTFIWPFLGLSLDQGGSPLPPEVAAQGLWAAQKWLWAQDPGLRSLVLLAEVAGLFLVYAGLRSNRRRERPRDPPPPADWAGKSLLQRSFHDFGSSPYV